MSTEKSNVIVELYDLSITERKDDRFGRVVTNGSMSEDDIINAAVARRTDLSPATMRATLELLKEVAKENIARGVSVQFGLGYYSLSVNGVFIGDNAKWDATKHSLISRVTPSAELRNLVSNATVDVRGMAEIGTVINTVTDVASGEVNTRLTPGGGVNITGSKIKIAGDNPTVGIALINQANKEITSIALNTVLTNEPSKLSFIVPATLATGDYKLSITTQYSSQQNILKEPRTSTFDYILTV